LGQNECAFAETQCPFLGAGQHVCQASVSALRIDAHRSKLCGSDDFDSCAIFLAHLLRRTRPKRADSDWLDAV
jgi:hypothetical protein